MAVITLALTCLALNVYHEARGEPLNGQYAVAYVTLNRAKVSGSSVCDVVGKKKQFSWANNGIVRTKAGWYLKPHMNPKNIETYTIAVQVASDVLRKRVKDSTKGADHYHAKSVKPSWAKKMHKVSIVGNHIFYIAKA